MSYPVLVELDTAVVRLDCVKKDEGFAELEAVEVDDGFVELDVLNTEDGEPELNMPINDNIHSPEISEPERCKYSIFPHHL